MITSCLNQRQYQVQKQIMAPWPGIYQDLFYTKFYQTWNFIKEGNVVTGDLVWCRQGPTMGQMVR
jgi:hypothetical protein